MGGLYDTVHEYDPRTGKGNGFVFSEFSSMALFNALQRAVELHKDPVQWRKLQQIGMAEDHSWDASAVEYEKLYGQIVALKKA